VQSKMNAPSTCLISLVMASTTFGWEVLKFGMHSMISFKFASSLSLV